MHRSHSAFALAENHSLEDLEHRNRNCDTKYLSVALHCRLRKKPSDFLITLQFSFKVFSTSSFSDFALFTLAKIHYIDGFIVLVILTASVVFTMNASI